MTGMTLAKATKEDFKTMWKVSKLMQDYGYEFYPDDDSRRAVRMKNLLMARLDQLGASGFMRIVMGCEMLIAECCDPAADHYALKPALGAAPEMLNSLYALTTSFHAYTRVGDHTEISMKMGKAAIAKATGRLP